MKMITWIAGGLLAGLCLAGVGAAEGVGGTNGVTNVEVAEAVRLVEAKQVVVLDVRTPEEFKEGRLAGAKNVDFNGKDFEAQLKELDREKEYLVYCRSGRRSAKAMETFKKLGFKSIKHLEHGYNAWVKAERPVEK